MDINELKISPIERRFWRNVRKSEGCWEWAGDKQGNGYGRLQFNGKRMMAHRISYMLNSGHIDSGNVVHHVCCNKICVNPDHLQSVTPLENTRAHYNGYGY